MTVILMKVYHTMKTHIIKIGNSQGVRIPKMLLEQSGLGAEVEIEVQESQIIIRSVARPRQGWEEAFRAMAAQHDDQLLDSDLTGQTNWDEHEWQW
jgi:antitoxin MazE